MDNIVLPFNILSLNVFLRPYPLNDYTMMYKHKKKIFILLIILVLFFYMCMEKHFVYCFVSILSIYIFCRYYQLNKGDNKNERMDELLLQLSDIQPEIICLQECFESSRRFAKLREFAIANNYSLHQQENQLFMSGGVIILSKYHILYSRYLTFITEGAWPDNLVDKGFLHAKLDVGGEHIHIINTHLQSEKEYIYIRKLQLLEILKYTKTFPKNESVFILGDFNGCHELWNFIDVVFYEYTNSLYSIKKGYRYTYNTYCNNVFGNDKQVLDTILWKLGEKSKLKHKKSLIDPLKIKYKKKLPHSRISDHLSFRGFWELNLSNKEI
jgi:endonuclease/exonuclease/phosphatase family metal-dependent hydrolase